MVSRTHAKRIKCDRVTCEICGKGLAAHSLKLHLKTQHDVFSHVALSPDLINEDRNAIMYLMTMITAKGVYPCPSPNCQGRPKTKYGIRRYFVYLHLQDLAALPG